MNVQLKTEIPGPKTKKWLDYNLKYSPPSTFLSVVWDVTEPAEGSYFTDPDGNVMLDFYGHVGGSPLGYNNKEIIDSCGVPFDPFKIAGHDSLIAVGDDPETQNRAINRGGQPIFFATMGDLLEKLVGTFPKDYGFDKAFLVNSGAEAVENAIKISFYRKFKIVRERLGEALYEEMCRQLDIKKDYVIQGLYSNYPFYGIACEKAFHGRTLGALSHTTSKITQREGFPVLDNVRHVPFNGFDLEQIVEPTELKTLITEKKLRAVIHEKRKIPSELLAYIIVEPIQGEGGYNIAHYRFIYELYKLAKNNNALFISDEIQSGVGRTGRFWCIEHYNAIPDVVCAGKALRLGAVISKTKHFPKENGVISSTWDGGQIETAVAYKTLEIIQDNDTGEGLMWNAFRKGLELREKLKDISTNVIDIRGFGLMCAVEFTTKDLRDKAVNALFENGLLTLGCGEKTLRMLPRLDVTSEEIDEAVMIFKKTFNALEGKVEKYKKYITKSFIN